MGLEKIKKYFIPTSILDIGANQGQFYREAKLVFPNSYFFLVEGNQSCEEALKGLNVDYSISMLSDYVKEVDFFVRKDEPTCTGNSIYREKTSFYDDDQIRISKVKTNRLADLFVDRIFDLIKIDVQGSEIDIIEGGIEIIKKSNGLLLEVSLTEYNFNAPTKEFVMEYMKRIDFLPVEIIGNINHPITHELVQQDILFLNQKTFQTDI